MKRTIDNKKVKYNANGDEVEINANLKIDSKIMDSSGNELKAVVANPESVTTGTLSKIKIGDTAYAVGGGIRNLEVASTFVSVNGNHIKNALTITSEEKAKILTGEIDTISGVAYRNNGQQIPFCVTRFHKNEVGPSSAPTIIMKFYGINYDDNQSAKRTLKEFELTISSDSSDYSLNIYEFNPTMGE